jgi:hypothetical protein
MPLGDESVIVVELELMPRQPTSMAPVVLVVTPGTAAGAAARPLALLGPASSGLVGWTPVYLAIPPPLATDPDRTQLKLPGSEAPARR